MPVSDTGHDECARYLPAYYTIKVQKNHFKHVKVNQKKECKERERNKIEKCIKNN